MAADREMIEVRTGWAASLGSPPGQISLSRSRPVTASGSLLPQSGRTSAWRAASSPHVPRGRNAHYPDRQRVHPPAACRGREDPWSDRRRPLFKHDSEPLGPFRLAADQRGALGAGISRRYSAKCRSRPAGPDPIGPSALRWSLPTSTRQAPASRARSLQGSAVSRECASPLLGRAFRGQFVHHSQFAGPGPHPHSARVGVSLPPSPDISGRIRASSPGIELVADGGFLAH
jgi:hypothetical protein